MYRVTKSFSHTFVFRFLVISKVIYNLHHWLSVFTSVSPEELYKTVTLTAYMMKPTEPYGNQPRVKTTILDNLCPIHLFYR